LGTPHLEVDVATDAEDLDLFIYLKGLQSNGELIITRGNHDEPNLTFCRGL